MTPSDPTASASGPAAVFDGPPGLPRRLDPTPDERAETYHRGVVTPRSRSAVGIFAAALLLAALVFVGPIIMLTRGTGVEAEPSPSLAPAATTFRATTPGAAAVRIASASGSAERLDSGAYRVTFAWMLEGARAGDSAVIRFSAGSRQPTETRGTLDPTVFSASTGRLALVTSQECSGGGWTAELISLRGLPPVGDAVARVAGVTCS